MKASLMSQRIFNSNTCRILFATCLSALCLIALSTQAATISVINTNDSGGGSLRQALAGANNEDTINFDSSLNGQTITLGPLQDNGGLTFTHLPASNSLAIDAGDPTVGMDQRGLGFQRVANGRIDIGATEVQATSTPTPTPHGHGRH